MQLLDPRELPLEGRRLIEASAGTGKTYTIASLILRLLLGRGTSVPLGLGEILVVTFTRAATEELRIRIRTRLGEACRAFDGGLAAVEDAFLASLVEDSADPLRDLALLRRAELDLDLAAIFTIHGFAQRMLGEHAFESRASFAARIDERSDDLVDETLLDFWRERVYPLPPLAADSVLAGYGGPDAFLAKARRLLGRHGLSFRGLPEQDWDALLRALDTALARLCVCWKTNGVAFREAMGGVRFNKDARERLPPALDRLDAACADGGELDGELVECLSRDWLAGRLNRQRKDNVLPASPVFDAIDEVLAAGRELPARLLADAVTEGRQRLAARKAASGRLGFDDLLRLLDEGLSAPGGERLARAIRTQYPAALIDEFQDTDPLQWRVFSRIYRDAGTLLLIGDPKQAIYSFRGADIHAYIDAKRSTSEHYALGTNFRSVGPLVSAINRLFETQPDGDPFLSQDDIPFESVAPSGRPDETPLLLNGSLVTPLQFICEPEAAPLSAGEYRRRMASFAAAHLAGLLRHARVGTLRCGESPLCAGDVAILVRDRIDAAAMQIELARRAIPFVYQGRDSVFDTREARDLYQLLAAMLAPGDEARLRAAMATALMGRTSAELDALRQDEQALLDCQDRFGSLRVRLQDQGPLAAFRRLLLDNDVPRRLLARSDGERRLTNCLHIAELLQLERAALDSDEALLSTLARLVAQPNGDLEQQQLRLESDAERVQIVTVHRSKGLEYPLVYLPFPSLSRLDALPLYHDPQSLRSVYDLSGAEAARTRSERERLGEDMRLLYVALTRAVHVCVVGLAPVEQHSSRGTSALEYLLGLDRSTLADVCARLATIPGVAVVAPSDDAGALEPEEEQREALRPRIFRALVSRDWQISSYSALVRRENEALERVFRQPELAVSEARTPVPGRRDIFAFPRGARHGSFLHRILEYADFAAVSAGVDQRAFLREALARDGYDSDWDDVLEQMLRDVLGCDLDGRGLRLGQIPADRRQSELGFDLALEGLDAAALNALLRTQGGLSARAQGLEFPRLRGMFSGFIDLVFEHGGRYYVADFKSNHLGDTLDAYTGASLEQSILHHRYDLQYVLYTLALHRLLDQRLGRAYEYERHVGGAFYLFLRGIRARAGNSAGVFFARPARDLILALDALFRGRK